MRTWANAPFNLKSYFDLVACAHADLYEGAAGKAHLRVQETWAPLDRSLCLMIQQVRIEALHLRGRAALACVLDHPAGGDRNRLLAAAERDARWLRRSGAAWGVGLGELLVAGVARARGDAAAASAHLGSALAICEEQGMMLHAMAARAALGRLLQGDDGQKLGQAALEWAAAQGVRRPDRLFALVAPALG